MARDLRALRHTIDLSEEEEVERVRPLVERRTTRSQIQGGRQPAMPPHRRAVIEDSDKEESNQYTADEEKAAGEETTMDTGPEGDVSEEETKATGDERYATPDGVPKTPEEWQTQVKDVPPPSKRRKSTAKDAQPNTSLLPGRMRNVKLTCRRDRGITKRRFVEPEGESEQEPSSPVPEPAEEEPLESAAAK